MRIFVTSLLPCPATELWPHSSEARLLSDDLRALAAFRFEFHIRAGPLLWSPVNTPYHQLDAFNRKLAIENGALPINADEFNDLVHFWRAKSQATMSRLLAGAPSFAARLKSRPVPA